MKILLVAINAKYIHSNLAVYSLRSMVREKGGLVEIAEYTINQRVDTILRDLYLRQPQVICFSCYIWNIRMVGELAEELSKVCPGVRIWLGGPEVTHCPEEILARYLQTEGVMRGEGEGIFPYLVENWLHGGISLEEIRGITWRGRDGHLRKTEDAVSMVMDEIPFPYEDLDFFRHKIVYYESSRGCPFLCSYCLSSLDKRVRYRSQELVERELALFLEKRIPQVKFVDRTFNCDPKRTEKLLRWIVENDNGCTNFHFEVSAELLTEEELKLMERMRPGLIQLEIGVQSTSVDTLREIRRRADLEKLEEVVARIRAMGNIHQHLDLIAGLPYEDLDGFHRSFDRVFAMKPDQLQLGFLKILKGTRMEAKAKEYGMAFHRYPPYEVMSTRWLTYGELLLLKQVEEMVEVYYNSRQFDCTLREILKEYSSPFVFFCQLGDYYHRRGYDEMSHSRMARYEILREFIRDRGWDQAGWDACMVYDLYSRERLKSRPSFAADQSPYRERLREYERQYGKKVHIEAFPVGEEAVYVLFDYDRRDPLTKKAYTERINDQ